MKASGQCFGNLAVQHSESAQNERGGGFRRVERPAWLTRDGTCYVCKGRRFWLSTHGVLVCATCHPPAAEYLVAKWIESEGSNEKAGS